MDKNSNERSKFIQEMRWMIYSEESFTEKPFGFIKIIDQFGLKLVLHIFPPDFIEFC